MNDDIKCDVIGQMDNTIDHTFESANRVYSVDGIAPACNTNCGGGHKTKVLIKQATKDGYIEMEYGGVFDGSFPSSSTRRGRVQEGGSVSPTLTAQNNELYRLEINKIGSISNKGSQSGAVYEVNGVSQTLCACTHGYAMGNILENYRIRKLTPKECFRLMGVTDDDADKMLAVNSNTQCYKQAGNSIVVDVMVAMFKKLFD